MFARANISAMSAKFGCPSSLAFPSSKMLIVSNAACVWVHSGGGEESEAIHTAKLSTHFSVL